MNLNLLYFAIKCLNTYIFCILLPEVFYLETFLQILEPCLFGQLEVLNENENNYTQFNARKNTGAHPSPVLLCDVVTFLFLLAYLTIYLLDRQMFINYNQELQSVCLESHLLWF